MSETLAGLRKSHGCGDLRATDAGKQVTIMGWVQKRRDHGGLVFVDLRDRSGLVQVVLNPEGGEEAFQKADKVRNEFVLAVVGTVCQRPEGTVNVNLPTGEIEVKASEMRILNKSKTPPFYIEDNVDCDEIMRLKYRYLDLRRPEMQKNLILRHKVTMAMREYLDEHGFLEIETPMLGRSTPEGARYYLVPSRVHPGEFYALPQSPQQYKQILMVSGMERYFQIARCFRDEDLRADRQPEFTQLDIEMSFIEREQLYELMENMIAYIFKKTLGREVKTPFLRLPYAEAMGRFGSDKPDLRFGMELKEVTDIAKESQFQVFASIAANGGQVKGINAEGCAKYSRKDIDDLTKVAGIYGAKGLAYFIVEENGVKSPIAKFFAEEQIKEICTRLEAKPGDLLLFVAADPYTAVSYTHLDVYKRQVLWKPVLWE